MINFCIVLQTKVVLEELILRGQYFTVHYLGAIFDTILGQIQDILCTGNYNCPKWQN